MPISFRTFDSCSYNLPLPIFYFHSSFCSFSLDVTAIVLINGSDLFQKTFAARATLPTANAIIISIVIIGTICFHWYWYWNQRHQNDNWITYYNK